MPGLATEQILNGFFRVLKQDNDKAWQASIGRTRRTHNSAITPFGLVFPITYGEIYLNSVNSDFLLMTAAHAIAHLKYSQIFNSVGKLKELSQTVIAMLEDERVENMLEQNIFGLNEMFKLYMQPYLINKFFGIELMLAKLAVTLKFKKNIFEDYWCEKSLNLFERALLNDNSFKSMREIGTILANDLGQMRYRFDQTSFHVWPEYRDDHSILWEDPHAEQKINESLSFSSASKNSNTKKIIEDDPIIFYYDEWNNEKEKYIPGFVKLTHIGKNNNEHVKYNNNLNINLHSIQTKAGLIGPFRRFESTGNYLDIDRTIQREIDIRCQITPDEKLFKSNLSVLHKKGVVLLLDSSESANDRINGTFQSILDLEKITLLNLAINLTHLEIPFSISSFNSNTKDNVNFHQIKNFNEYWTVEHDKNIRSISAKWSTRMGSALRHANKIASNQVEKAIILILTDGMPSDIDVTIPNYFSADARMAVKEIIHDGNHVFCFKIGNEYTKDCKEIFGASKIISCSPENLFLSIKKTIKIIKDY